MTTGVEFKMEFVKVQGAEVPKLGLGTWELAGQPCREAVRDALEIGYRHIDTAQAYENEREVGDGIRQAGVPREEIFVTTKVFRNRLDRDGVLESTDESLEKLQTEYVDLLLIHWPNDAVPVEETLDAMIELKEQRKVRHIGVSNFPPSQVDEARKHAAIFCNQVEYHPYLDQGHLVEQCRENDMMLTAYSPLARGEVAGDDILAEIGDAYGKSAAQVGLRWLVQQGPVAAIPKAGSADHRRTNLEIFDFELTDDEMDRIFAMRRGNRIIDPEWAPDWER